MKHIFLFISLILFFSCSNVKKENITNKKDYDKFLNIDPPKTTSKYFELWNNKIKPDSMQLLSFGYVASEYDRFFKETGDINFLKKGEQALTKAVGIAAVNKAGYKRALARNYISQHRFKEALKMAEDAIKLGSGVEQSQSLLFDIHMELGNYTAANKYLDSIRNMGDFGYLIRLAKWNDYKGDLKTTIRFMEKACTMAENSKNNILMLWSYTNLADYYGHAGKIEESYKHYLKALALDPKSAYAKKGISWIVFSYEKNPKEALRILDSITRYNNSPDYLLLKSEIYQYMKDELGYLANLDEYHKAIQNKSYGDMYNATTIMLYAEHTQQHDKAIALAEKEVLNRPTPQSYALLAYSHLRNGNKHMALEIVKNHIEGKTTKPMIIYHMAEILKANGNMEQVKRLKPELLDATFEMGPEMENKISTL